MAPYDLPLVRSKQQLLDDGWSEGAILRAAARGRLLRVRAGLFAAGDANPVHADVVAAVKSTSGSVASHRTAALLHGIPLLGPAPTVPELTVGARRTGDVLDAHLYRARLPPTHVTSIDGLPVTSVARTLADLARDQSLTAGVVAGDFILRNGLTDRATVDQALLDCRGWPQIRRARAARDLLDARSESPLESYSRIRLTSCGLPMPDLQTSITTLTGRFVGRVDFYWDEAGVVGEADGRSKYDDRDVLLDEKRRQERLEELGLIVVRWTWMDVRHRRNELVTRIEQALVRGRAARRSSPRLWLGATASVA